MQVEELTLAQGLGSSCGEEGQGPRAMVPAAAGWRTGVGIGWNFSLECCHVLGKTGSKVFSCKGGWMRKYYSI